MQKKTAPPTLDTRELDVIQMLFGLGSPAPTSEATPREPRMSEAEVKRVEEQALRKLRYLKLEQLTHLRRAG